MDSLGLNYEVDTVSRLSYELITMPDASPKDELSNKIKVLIK